MVVPRKTVMLFTSTSMYLCILPLLSPIIAIFIFQIFIFAVYILPIQLVRILPLPILKRELPSCSTKKGIDLLTKLYNIIKTWFLSLSLSASFLPVELILSLALPLWSQDGGQQLLELPSSSLRSNRKETEPCCSIHSDSSEVDPY